MIKNMTLSQRLLHWGLRLYGALICLFLIGPIFVFVPLSFSERPVFHYPIESFSLRWYADLMASPMWTNGIVNSLLVGSASSIFATGLGILAALGLWSSNFRIKPFIMAVLLTPMIVPSIIAAVSIYMAFARVGLNSSFSGLILAHTALASPMVVITVLATLSRFDATLLRAASSLGAGPILAFRKVTLPLIMPGVAGGLIFAFALSFDDVVVALFVAGPKQKTLPVQMYLASNDLVDLTITAAATVLLAMAIVFMLAIEILKRRDPLSKDQAAR